MKSINDNYKFNNLEIGVSVKSDPLESKNRWYQDWGLWLEKEFVDYVIIEPSDNNYIDYMPRYLFLPPVYQQTTNYYL